MLLNNRKIHTLVMGKIRVWMLIFDSMFVDIFLATNHFMAFTTHLKTQKRRGGSIPFLFCYCIFLLCWYFKSIISARSTHCPLNEHSAQISICLLFIKNNNIFKIRLSLDMNFCIHFKMYILSLLSQRIIILWAFFATFVAFRYSCNYQVSMRRTIIQNGSWFQADYQKFFFEDKRTTPWPKEKELKCPQKSIVQRLRKI